MSAQDMESTLVESNDDIHLFDIALVLLKYKAYILGIPFIVAILMALGSSFIPNTYTASTVILLPQSQSGTSALLGQLSGGLGAVAGGALGVKSPSDVYIAMLKSRTMAGVLIERFKLADLYRERSRENLENILKGQSVFTANKDGTIKIEVSGRDPKFAAILSNGYVEELQNLMQKFAVGEASQRRLFFEQQIQKVRKDLVDAEDALKHAQEKTGLIQLSGQAEALIKGMVELKAQISAKEVALESMSAFATHNHPDYVRLKKELTALQAQLQKAENGVGSGNGNIGIATGKVPEFGLEYVRKLRDVKYYETILELLAKQYEVAKIDEAKQGTLIQVLDKAEIPEHKSGPKRSLMVLMAGLGSLFLILIGVFVKEAWGRAQQKPEFQEKMTLLRKYGGWRGNN